MNSEHPADYAPLSYGAALAIGLMLILGLPVEAKQPPGKAAAPPKPRAAGQVQSAACCVAPATEPEAAETAGCES